MIRAFIHGSPDLGAEVARRKAVIVALNNVKFRVWVRDLSSAAANFLHKLKHSVITREAKIIAIGAVSGNCEGEDLLR
jgi:fibrillarin-like rRNA methylase